MGKIIEKIKKLVFRSSYIPPNLPEDKDNIEEERIKNNPKITQPGHAGGPPAANP